MTPPVSLQTLGGLTLKVGGHNITGAVTQRRRLALLVLLAAAGARGLPRDKILALLWPETPEQRARHALAQQLYSQRLDLEMEELFLGTKTLRLNPAVMATDLEAYADALGRGDLIAATQIYLGPFLDGVHLGVGEEFERWQDGERDRLSRSHGAVLERLADEASERGDALGAAEWWRQRTQQEPTNTRVVAGLVRALLAAGDRAGAIRSGEAHRVLLRRELGVEPDANFVGLLTSLRL